MTSEMRAQKDAPRFPQTINAALALEAAGNVLWDAQWALGDALVDECGSPGEHGVNTGALKKVEKVLRQHQLDYSYRRLEQFRSTAFKFQDRRRLRSVSFDAHLVASDPDTLAKAQAQSKKDKVKLSVRYVTRFVRRQKDELNDKNRRNNGKLNGRPKADHRREDAIEAFDKTAAEATERARYAVKMIRPYLGGLSANERQERIKSAGRVIAAWTDAVNELQFELHEAAE
jgi:hypothetical protein